MRHFVPLGLEHSKNYMKLYTKSQNKSFNSSFFSLWLNNDIYKYEVCFDNNLCWVRYHDKDKEYYYCSSFVRNHSCTNHSIRKDRLEELIFQDMKEKYPNIQFRKISNNVLNDFIDTIVVYDKNNIKITYKKNI